MVAALNSPNLPQVVANKYYIVYCVMSRLGYIPSTMTTYKNE